MKLKSAIKKRRVTTCKHCGNDKAYNFQFFVDCDKCGAKYSLLDDVKLKRD